jgi:hypothetical protein
MTKSELYLRKLRSLTDWTPYLLKESGLPGPRGNLELAQVVAEVASKQQVEKFLSIPSKQAPENSPGVFLVFCGLTALGKWAGRGDRKELARLRRYASDPRWRVREAVAIALQYVGDADMTALLKEMRAWSRGSWYEKRAAAAALAEPRLLRDPKIAAEVLEILNTITSEMQTATDTKTEPFKVLRRSMGYCWSVAVAACPQAGKPLMGKWIQSQNPDVRWILGENLKKARLMKMDSKWVRACVAALRSAASAH